MASLYERAIHLNGAVLKDLEVLRGNGRIQIHNLNLVLNQVLLQAQRTSSCCDACQSTAEALRPAPQLCDCRDAISMHAKL